MEQSGSVEDGDRQQQPSEDVDYSSSASSKKSPAPSLDYALSVFTQIPRPDNRISNKLLRQLSRGAEPEKTLLVYKKMRRDGLGVDKFSFPPLLKAVSRASALEQGMEIHKLASKLGLDPDPFVQTGLVGMYAACGWIMEARLVFDKMSHRDVVTWSIMVDGYGY